MAQIESKDIRLYESEKLNDAPDGGGRVTSREIESGKVNNIFQDISRVDHVNGSIELRKIFMGIRTQNNAPLLGAHMIISEPPKDPNVHALVFQTPRPDRETDMRADARDYLETYFVRSSQGVSRPMGLNLAGSKTLTLFQDERVNNDISSGDTIVLLNTTSGIEEYVKIQQLSTTMRTFTYLAANGSYSTFRGRVLQCQLPTPLTNSWDGGEVRPTGPENRNLVVYTTTITDAAQYRGVTKLAAPASRGDAVIHVDNVLAPLVPVATSETAIVDASPYRGSYEVVAAGEALQTVSAKISANSEIIYTPTPITPGTLLVTSGDSSWMDDGAGKLQLQEGSVNLAAEIDYPRGRIYFTGAGNIDVTAQYQPAGAMNRPTVTGTIDITQGTMGLVYTIDVSDVPVARGTFVVEYLSNGDWQELVDVGNGTLEGMGSGTIDYQSTAQINLEHEPDIDSKIVYSYVPAGAESLELVSGAVQYTAAEFQRVLVFPGPFEPGTVSVSINDGANVSTDDGSGQLTGDAGSGTIDYSRGRILLTPLNLPTDTVYTVTAQTGPRQSGTYEISVSGSQITINVGSSIEPKTLSIAIPVTREEQRKSSVSWGASDSYTSTSYTTLRLYDRGGTPSISGRPDAQITIDYQAGVIVVGGLLETYSVDKLAQRPAGLDKTTISVREEVRGLASASFMPNFDDYQEDTREIVINAASIQILDPEKRGELVPRSLVLNIDGDKYYEQSGKLITNWSAETGAGEEVGTIDMLTGTVSMRNLPGNPQSISIESLLLTRSVVAAENLNFVIQQRPIRHASFTANYQEVGSDVTRRVMSDQAGNIIDQNTDKQIGTIDFNTGIVSIDWSVVDAAVLLGTMRFNAINTVTLPLDPEIVGLNVQRLPIDGRVPIFKLGDTVVLNHTDTETISEPVAGQTITLERDHIAELHIYCGEDELSPEQYIVDLEAGTVEFSSSLELVDENDNPLTGTEWTAEHRIEHMSLATRVQLNGAITLQAASAHDFPEGSSVSSALLFGDLMADVANMFSQRTWQDNNPNWSDTPDSSGTTTARYDTINYPVEVDNYSAVTGRWAIIFRTPSTVDVVNEQLGVIETGLSISNNIAPINPTTEEPYFVLRREGWGAGWATGNVVRFNTVSALGPCWVARTVMPAQGITDADSFTLSPRGDSQ